MNSNLKQKFINMAFNNTYLDLYFNLIENALLDNRIKLKMTDENYIYYECHHILPKCIFGDEKNNKENLVLLTAREHFLAHMYLTKLFDSAALDFAFWRLCTDNRGRNITVDEYEQGKLFAIQRSKEINTGRLATQEQKDKMLETKKKNGTLNHSEETKQKISAAHKGLKPSESTKQKISTSKTGKHLPKWSEERKATLSNKYKGDGNPMFHKRNKDYMTESDYEQYKKHLSDSLKGHAVSEETKQKISQTRKLNGKSAGGNNVKAKTIFCIEDNLLFTTLTACANYYNLSRYIMTEIAKTGYYTPLDKHFKILNKNEEKDK